MARPRSTRRTTLRIDEAELAAFRAGLRRRYSDEDILGELRAAAERLGRSPTMREFAADPQARVHPQTVIGHFGTWNAAKRAAGLFPRRFSTREELLEQLRRLGEELGRTPTARDLAARRRSLPSASLYAHTFGSLAAALREAGFEVLQGEERLERAIEQGAGLARALGRWEEPGHAPGHSTSASASAMPSGRPTSTQPPGWTIARRRPWARSASQTGLSEKTSPGKPARAAGSMIPAPA